MGDTAATVLLTLGLPDRTVMEIVGWSTVSMKARYMHVTEDCGETSPTG
ncbi:hypothetical protein [Saccharomonospora marina]|nr:hypothetical protein [Saccharomonospora marina]